MTPYLLQLNGDLISGLQGLAPERRQRHLDFVLSRQQTDGGFGGREDESDLYYTAFAVRSLLVLGGLSQDVCQSLIVYLREAIAQPLSVIDRVSWLATAINVQIAGGDDASDQMSDGWMDDWIADFESLRRKDGGYAKTAEGAAGSTYHSFLVVLTYQLLNRDIPDRQKLVDFLFDRQRDDGGFVEIGPMKRSGTNPTAAAVALLQMFGQVDEPLREDVEAFLKEVKSDEGGFQANTRVPFADGLSTFTGLLTCRDLNLNILDRNRAAIYTVRGLELESGGFRGATWDEQADVEYTFYGLGNLALLADALG